MWKKIKDSKTHVCMGEKFRYAYQTKLKILMVKSLFEAEFMVAFPVKNLSNAKKIVQLIED